MGRHKDDINLTPREKKLLIYIKQAQVKTGIQPNMIDMAGAMEMSVGKVQLILRKAEAAGIITRSDGKARSIRFLKEVGK